MSHFKGFILVTVLLSAAVFLAPSISTAKDYYIWTDSNGTVHITDSVEKAPEGHRVVKYPEPAGQTPGGAEPSLTELERLILEGGVEGNGKPVVEKPTCRTLDVVEFGIIGAGFTDPWSEVQLVEKYGPPCEIIHLGDVFFERSFSKVEKKPDKDRKERGAVRSGFYAERKQFVYWGDYTNATSVITIVNGVVVSKERLYK